MSQDKINQLFYDAEQCVQEKNDTGRLQELIDQGLDINRKDQFGISLAERAIFGAINYDALYCLWKAKAIPQTEYIEEVFDLFRSGKSPQELYSDDEKKKNLKLKKALDITNVFSIKKLKISNAFFEITREIENVQDSEIVLTILLEPFVYNGHFTETELQFVGFYNHEMKSKMFSINGYEFKMDEIEPSSIYIQNVHNLVLLKRLRIKEGLKFNSIEANLFFDFESERTDYKNEETNWKFKTERK